jgi:hypothetical protein
MRQNKLLAAAIAAALTTGIVAIGTTHALAAEPKAKDTPAKATESAASKAAEEDRVRVSEDAMMTMGTVRGTRLAIFNGHPEQAKKEIDAAVKLIASTVRDADKLAVDTKTPAKDDRYVAFDASLTVADTFVPTEEKLKHIAKANEHLHKSEKKEALEVLKLGEVDVAFTTRLLPVKLAQQQIADAAKLVGEGKYYEANLALKALEDAVVTETFATLDDAPLAKR